VVRPILLTWLALAPLAAAGCAGTWDTITSRRFREHPYQTTKRMLSPEDPVAVLLADPPRPGYEQADAMRRLKEPARGRGTQEDQDAVLAVLERAALWDSSPVLRMEAIGALGRFEDPRAPGILMAAYRNAHGRKETDPVPQKPEAPRVVQAGASAGRKPILGLTDTFPLTGPTGFQPAWVSAVRCRAAEMLGRTNSPEAVPFLAAIAGGAGQDVAMDGYEDRDVRLAAVRGLGACRQPEAVAALAQVLQTEADRKDTAMIGRTHDGLVRLTGKKLPADPQAWNEVVQAGVVIAPEPSWVENMVRQAMFWQK
jgi:hypothetical protein